MASPRDRGPLLQLIVPTELGLAPDLAPAETARAEDRQRPACDGPSDSSRIGRGSIWERGHPERPSHAPSTDEATLPANPASGRLSPGSRASSSNPVGPGWTSSPAIPGGEQRARSGVTLDRDSILAVVEAAARNGVDWVQVRDHQATARELFAMVRDVVAICRPRGVRVAVNDRLDVALAAKADAVQLGERSLPVDVARKIAATLSIGVSVHDAAGAIRAEQDGADWVIFGHVFPTSSHPGEPPRGLTELTRVAASVRIPIIAIGGIDAENAPRAIGAGAAGIAVISAILHADDPGMATAALRRSLNLSASR